MIPFTHDVYKNIIPAHDLNVVMPPVHIAHLASAANEHQTDFQFTGLYFSPDHVHAATPAPFKERSTPRFKQSQSQQLAHTLSKVHQHITVLHLGDKVKLRRTEDWGRREVIRVNGITLTAYGWLQLFKTHLRMGNFLSGVFWELPHLVVAETGTEPSLQFRLCLKLFCQRPRHACVAPLLNPL